MNAAQGTQEGKAAKALSEYEGLATVRQALDKGSLTADELLAQLDAIESAEKPPEARADDAFAQQETPADQPEPRGDADAELEVRIRPSWLKAGNSVYKTVEAMSKGVAEKDRHIDHLQRDIINPLRDELSERESEVATLRAELEKRPQAAAVPANSAGETKPGEAGDEMPDLDNLPPLPVLKGDDIYDDEKQQAYQEAVAKREEALVRAIKVMHRRAPGQPAAARAEPTRDQGKPGTSNSPRAHDPSVDAEWAEIERFCKENPDLFESSTPLREVENRYFATVQSIAVKAGVRGGLYDERGQWRPEVRRAYEDFVNPTTESAKRLRQECEAAGIRLPPEMDDLNRLYRLWNTRVSIRQGNGNPISYADALALVRAREPDAFKRRDAREEAAREIEAEQRAREKRGQYARETPTQHDAGAEIGEMPVTRFMELMHKRNPTEAEKELIRRGYRYKGIPEDEWPESLRPPSK